MVWLNNVIESVIIKRIVAMLLQAIIAYSLAHCGIFDSWGIHISVDPEKMNDALTILFMSKIEYVRHVIAQRYPELSAWL